MDGAAPADLCDDVPSVPSRLLDITSSFYSFPFTLSYFSESTLFSTLVFPSEEGDVAKDVEM